MSRIDDFNIIQNSFAANNHVMYTNISQDAILVNDDALVALRAIPSSSISLLLTDPPYHSTKKDNIVNDKAFKADDDFISWIEQFAYEWKRILRPNGCGYMFCSSAMEARLEVMLSRHFNILSQITWTKPNEPGYDGWKGKMKKESLRQWYPHSERIIFFEMSEDGNLNRSPFGNLLRKRRLESKMSAHELTELTGAYGKVNHGGAVCNWEAGRNTPDREQYQKISDAFVMRGFAPLPDYEDAIRPFNVSAKIEFTDVWTFQSVKQYKGKHPAEKPVDLLEHCILSSSYEGDIVLDCFAGSGNTLVAARNTGRKSIGIEIDSNWYNAAINNIQDGLLTF